MRSKKASFVPYGDVQQLVALLPAYLSVRPSARPPVRPNRGLAHQFVGSDPDRERQPQTLTRLPPDAGGDVLRRTEEPAGTSEVEKGMTVPPRLDGRREDPQ